MTEQQIKDEVLRYIDDKAYNYAILIDGEWGSGKTYFVTKILSREIKRQEKTKDKPRQTKYISLYGCKTVNDVYENIVWSFAENARKKAKKRWQWGKVGDNISEGVLLVSKKVGYTALMKYLPENSVYKVASNWLSFEEFIFIFDDLERCECSLNEIFGFINELVEHENAKVIIIANEKEISGGYMQQNVELQYQLALSNEIKWPKDEGALFFKESNSASGVSFHEIERRRKLLFPESDVNEEYKKVREKLIGVTLRYEPDILSIIPQIIIASTCEDEMKKSLLERVSIFSNRMDYYNHHNLRTFQFFLSKVNYLLEQLSKIELDDHYREGILDQIIKETFVQAIRLKANFKPDNQDMLYFNYDEDVKSITIKKYVESGEFTFEMYQKDILTIQEEQKVSVGKNDPYYMLNQEYFLHGQEWCDMQLKEMIERIKDDIYPVTFFAKIIIEVQKFLDLGFDYSYMQQTKDAMIENIVSEGEVSIIDEKLFLMENGEFKEKIREVIAEINDVIISHSEQVSYKNIKEILQEDDWIDKLKKYTHPDKKGYQREVAVLSKAGSEEWVKKLCKANPKEIYEFRHWLNDIYPMGKSRSIYSQDATSIKEIKNKLKKIEEKDLIKKACIQWLVDQLQKIIQCNESESGT